MLRFASSPTSDMHIGDLRVALFNYIISKQKKEDFIVRIEDIDKEKYIDGKDKEILEILSLFKIEYSQVIYQSENIRFHTAMALQLMHEKKAFSCFCSNEWLDKKRDEAKADKKTYKYDDACANLPAELVIDNTNPFSIRIRKPKKDIIIKDYFKNDINYEAGILDSFIILKQDKMPTSDFSSAVDDMLSDISIIVRNENNINNTLRQNHIRNSLKYDKQIEYIHLPIILNDKDFSVKSLLEDGFLPEAIFNYLISIDVNYSEKIFTIKEAIKYFTLENISNSPILFDIEVLRDINQNYLKMLDPKELSRYVGFADEEIGKLAKVYLEEVSTTKELKSKISAIFAQKDIPNELTDISNKILYSIKEAPYFEKYEDFKEYIMSESKLNDKNFSSSLRYLLTGSKNGPDIAKIYRYLKNYIGEIIK